MAGTSSWLDRPEQPVPDDDPQAWRMVRVFVSSTFNDMHAERDLLVKRVFPRMRSFCESRRLWLVEVDLRWGVTEEEASANRNAVGICLRGVDRSHVFLGILGQRYGWQPAAEDLAEAEREFPALAQVAGERLSVTEMEIRRALGGLTDSARPPKVHLFYRRGPSYLANIASASPKLLGEIYRDQDTDGVTLQKRQDLENALTAAIVDYQGEWMPKASTPELRFPLRAPSSEPQAVASWQRAWRVHAGLAVHGSEIPAGSELAEAAERFNQELTAGRLGNFRSGDQALADRLVTDLESAIARAFPERRAHDDADPLSVELEQQEAFLMTALEGFVERPRDMQRLDQHLTARDAHTLFLAASAGSGKTTLLAKWIEHLRADSPHRAILFRFIGASDRSTRVEDLLRSLLAEVRRRFRDNLEIPDTDRELRMVWLDRVREALGGRPAVLVLDGLDQLDSGLDDLTWLPTTLPPSLAMVATFRLEGQAALDLHGRLTADDLAPVAECSPFSDDDKHRLVERFLERYLKRLDERHVQSLLTFGGARLPSAPLFLKVILSEIRLFGSFQNLEEEIRSSDGTPESAFGRLIARLQDDQAFSAIPPRIVLAQILPALALSRNGLSAEEMAELLRDGQDQAVSHDDAADAVHLATNQLRDALSTRAGRTSVFYSSLRSAILARFACAESGEHSIPGWHARLARLFQNQRRSAGGPTRWLSELPYHLASAGQVSALVELLSDLSFIEAKYAAGLGPELLADYDWIRDPDTLTEVERKTWQDFRRFVRGEHTVLSREPTLTRQQALNQPDASAAHAAARTVSPRQPAAAFVWENKPQRPLPITLRLPAPDECEVLCRDVGATASLLLEGTDNGRFLLTDLRTGRIVVDQQLGDPVGACALSADGHRAATVGGYRHLRLHQVSPWRLVDETLAPAPVERLRAHRAFDRFAAMAGWEVYLWHPGRPLTRLLATRARINDCAFSPDAATLATVGGDGRVSLWDANDGRLRWYSDRHAADAQTCVFSPSGRFLITGSQRHGALWDLVRERFVCFFDANLGGITALDVVVESDDGLAFVTAGDDGALEYRRGSCRTEAPTGWRLDLASGPLRALRVLPGSHDVVVDCEAGPALIVDLKLAEACAERGDEAREEILSLAITEQTIVSGDTDGWISFFDRRGVRTGRCRGHYDHVNSVIPLAAGPLCSAGSDGRLALITRETAPPQRHHWHERGLLCCALHPNDRRLAVGDDGGEIGIVELAGETARETLRFRSQSGRSILALRWLPTDGLLALATATSVETWNLASGMLADVFPHEVGIPVAFPHHPDPSMMALAGRDGRLVCWVAQAGSPKLDRRRLPLGQLTAAAFLSPQELVTAHTSGEVVLWRWPDVERLGLAPTGQRLQALALEPRARRVVAAGSAGSPLAFTLEGG